MRQRSVVAELPVVELAAARRRRMLSFAGDLLGLCHAHADLQLEELAVGVDYPVTVTRHLGGLIAIAAEPVVDVAGETEYVAPLVEQMVRLPGPVVLLGGRLAVGRRAVGGQIAEVELLSEPQVLGFGRGVLNQRVVGEGRQTGGAQVYGAGDEARG